MGLRCRSSRGGWKKTASHACSIGRVERQCITSGRRKNMPVLHSVEGRGK